MAKADLTAERLRELLHYSAETGVFVWRQFRGRNAKLGDVASNGHPSGYRFITVDGRSYAAHRLAWLHTYGAMPAKYIDHINGVRDDNRLENLRDVTPAVNKQNIKGARKDSKASGLVGAFWHNRANKWFSNIGVAGKRQHLGMFSTAEDAHAAYIEAKRRLHPGCMI